MLKDGFYPAVGPPVDAFGNVVEQSLKKQITDLLDAGASGLLLMGSMGQQPAIKASELTRIVKAAVDATNGRAPLFVGAMDNSVVRVKDRLEAIGTKGVDGIVMTTPYYSVTPTADVMNYFRSVAAATPLPLFLYDLAVVTKIKITLGMALELMAVPNFKGIKSGDINLARDLMNSGSVKDGFEILFSGLDIFDVAYAYGVRKNLDGMFCCTPKNATAMYKALAAGDAKKASKHLDNIVALRNVFVAVNVFPGFTYAMNELGYEGNFGFDYQLPVTDAQKELVRAKMVEIGEL